MSDQLPPSHRRFRQYQSEVHSHLALHGSPLMYARYLKLEGTCWIVIGVASIVCSWPSLIVRETYLAPGVASGAVVVLTITGVAALRCGLPGHHVHGWMCAGLLRSRTRAPSMRSTQAIWGLTRDAAIWIGATLGWLLLCRFGHVPPLVSSGSISLGIGAGIVLIGLLEAILSPRFVRRRDQNVGAISLVASRRPLGAGYPTLTDLPLDDEPRQPGLPRTPPRRPSRRQIASRLDGDDREPVGSVPYKIGYWDAVLVEIAIPNMAAIGPKGIE